MPLLERLAQLPAVPVARILALLERMGRPDQDPLLARLVGVDEEGERVISPLVAAVLQHLQREPGSTCYQAMIEALTGIWNAAVRAAAAERREWVREWLADPVTHDGALVEQCLVRLLLAVRGMAEARAAVLTASGPP